MGSSTSNAKGPELPCDDGKCDGPELDEGHFEFVVVGSGAGGGPLAASLARAGHRTLLLEAGAWPGGSLTYSIPALHPQASEDPELSWSFLVDHYGSDPDAARDTKMVWDERTGEAEGIFYPRGSAVGGSTAVNAMITMTPHDSDWNYIADLTGDDSWRADHMRRYFTRIERNRYLERHGSEAEGHGFDGWLSTEQPDASIGLKDRRLRRQVTAAAFVAGDGLFEDIHQLFGLLDRDINAPGPERDAMEGVFGGAMATDGGRRNGTAEYLRRTIDEGYPLTLRTRSLVTNVVWADESAEDGTPVAVGVEYLEGGSLYGADRRAADALGSLPERRRVTVTREVILSAGAFNTPQLLKLSGVGPAAELDALGIETRVDLPGVGTNLQDRYEVGVVTEAPGPYSATLPCSFDTSVEDECMEKWRTGEGPYTANGPAVALIQRSSVAVHDPDLFIFGLPGFFKGYYPGYSADIAENRALFTWLILKGHTRNQAGTVTLRSTDPRVPPHIDFDYFRQGAGHDLQAMVEGVHTIRSIIDKVNDLTLFGRDTVEVWPGAEADTDDEVAQWVRDEAWGHHASCSAPIGRDGDGMAVLDSRFRVRGTTGLRVVDASVFPRIPGFFIAVPTMMVSEKAADVILADLGEPRDGRFVDHADVDIPDMDELGVVREIEIPESMGTVSGLSITIDIEHTWRGDLRIVLERDGREVVLLEHEGSSRDDVHTTVVVDEFDGEAAAGTWRLRVADRVRADLGTLRSWSINLGG